MMLDPWLQHRLQQSRKESSMVTLGPLESIRPHGTPLVIDGGGGCLGMFGITADRNWTCESPCRVMVCGDSTGDYYLHAAEYIWSVIAGISSPSSRIPSRRLLVGIEMFI